MHKCCILEYSFLEEAVSFFVGSNWISYAGWLMAKKKLGGPEVLHPQIP